MAKTKDESGAAEPTEVTKGLDALVQQALTDERFLDELQADPAAALGKHGYPANEGIVSRIRQIDFAGLRDAFRVSSAAAIPLPYC